MGKKFWANLILSVLLGVLFVFGITTMSSALTPKGLFVKEPVPSPEVAGLMDKVRLVDYRLSEDKNRMVHAGFALRNTSEKELKNFKIQCEFYDADGTYLDRKTWLLSEKLPPGKMLTKNTVSKRFVNTRANGLQCRLVDFEISEPPSFVLHRVEGGHGGAEEAAHGGGHGEAPAH